MAHFDEIGEYGLDQLLTRRLTTPGGSVAPSVAPELFPGITLENDRPEWGYLKGEIPYARSAGPAAPVNNQFLILRNPAGSGILAVVSLCQAQASTGSVRLYVAPIGNLATGVNGGGGASRDGRITLVSGGIHVRVSTCLLFTADAVAPGFNDSFRSVSSAFAFTEPIILAPGTDVGIMAATATATLGGGFSWTERRAQPGELV